MSGHGIEHVDPANKKIALLIAVLALFLALSETMAKSAQTSALNYNIEASNLWAFFQAKTIRMTTLRTAADAAETEWKHERNPAKAEALQKQMEGWRKVAATYDSEPDKGEGRKELSARAKAAEAKRAHSMAAYHYYELSSAALQIAIVLASAEIITGVVALVWISGGLGVVAVALGAIGMFAPMAIHLF
ncbi:MAG: DUF4337 domain-containing protein [Syntrophaceae bacterium]|nr:DUF4337 domain-containing protein [Syntrophaceae bacterium]